MRASHLLVTVLASVFALGAVNAFADTSLDQLLEQTKESRKAEADLAAKRAADFTSASSADQERMLKEALSNRDAAQATAKDLSGQYSANELSANQVADQINQKEKDLGVSEVFGLAKQVAGDLAGTLEQSMVTAQFPPGSEAASRSEFLRQFTAEKTVPTEPELERVWTEMQREMVEDARVLRFNANVIQPNGEAVQSSVIRIGPFTAISGGKYLSYMPDLKSLSMLPRQPPSEILEAAERLEKATSGYVPAIVDATRGVLLSLYVERPTFIERINQGAWVGYVIIAVFFAGALAFIFQLFYLIFVRLGVSWQLRHLNEPRKNNPLGRVLLAFKGDPKTIEEDADIAELRISEAVLHEVPRLERFQALLRLAVAAGPLLGLIGTVIGMIITFQSITEAGTGDPRLMAHGIGQAMIATVLGLGCAIPLLFANAGLASLSRTVIQILDEQSAGLLAESLERRRHA